MITLKSIKLHNFLSHKDTLLEFSDNEKLLLDGRSGSGKSSVVEALLWCLYGKGRADNRSMIRRGQRGTNVRVILKDLHFERNMATFYLIDRSATASGKHDLKVYSCETGGVEPAEETYTLVEANGIKGTQEYIEKEILKSSYTLFVNSIVYPQEGHDSFVNQGAARRKEIILEIAKADQYDHLYIKTREKLIELEGNIANIDGRFSILTANIEADSEKILFVDSWTQTKVNIEEQIRIIEEKKQDKRASIASIKEEMAVYNEKKRRLNAIQAQIDGLHREISELSTKIFLLENNDYSPIDDINHVAELREKQKNLQTWTETMLQIMKNKPVDLQYETRIAELNQRYVALSNLDSIADCPEVDKKCPILVKERREQLAKVGEELERCVGLQRDYQSSVEKYTEAITGLGDKPVFDQKALIEAEERIRSNAEAVETKKKLESAVAASEKALGACLAEKLALEGELSATSDKSVIVSTITLEINALEAEQASVMPLLREVSDNLAVVEDARKRLAVNAEEKEKIIGEKAVLKKQTDGLELLKEALSPRGIKNVIIDFVLPRLEDKINNILHQLSDFTIRLDTQKASTGGDKTLEGLFITIYNEQGESFDFNNYSGGEKLKITVAISEALSEIQQIGFRVLDELFIGLDEESTDSFVNILGKLQSRLSQFICISHLRGIKDAFPKKLTAVKLGGITKIE